MPEVVGKGKMESSGERIGRQNSTGRQKTTEPGRKRRSPTPTGPTRTSIIGEKPGRGLLDTGEEHEGGAVELESEECVIPRSKKRRGRVGAANYSKAEINALLVFVHEVEPVGSYHWGDVHGRMPAWAAENDHHARDIESLKNKFHKLSNTKKSSGDPDCPPEVRRTKFIAKENRDTAFACTLGGLDDEEPLQSTQSEDSPQSPSTVAAGTPVAKRATGSRGSKRKFSPAARRNDENLSKITEPLKDISNKFGALLDILRDDMDGDAGNLRDKVEEVKTTLANTNNRLSRIEGLLHKIYDKSN